MKSLRLLALSLLITASALAQSTFPGLRKVLTDAEWKRAGLDQLTPDQIGVIDAALIRTQAQVIAVITTPPSLTPEPGMSPVENAVARSRFWDFFGLGKGDNASWRTMEPMRAKVTGWQGANRFSLDTGQVWEGVEPIPYEILGATISIEARPLGAFALKLNENSVAVRVRRVK